MYSRPKLSLSRDCSNLFWRRLRSSPSVLEQMSVPAEKFAKKERRKEIIVNTKEWQQHLKMNHAPNKFKIWGGTGVYIFFCMAILAGGKNDWKKGG